MTDVRDMTRICVRDMTHVHIRTTGMRLPFVHISTTAALILTITLLS
jgi:hypothetical protein